MLIRLFLTWARARQAARNDATASARAIGPAQEISAETSAGSPSEALRLYRAGLTGDAAQAAAGLLAVNPRDTEGLLVSGLFALDEGNAVEGRRMLEKAAKDSPSNFPVLVALGRAYVATGRQVAARERFQQASKLVPDSAEPHLHLALMALRAGQDGKAQELLQSAIEREPSLVDAHFHLGNILRARGDKDAAEWHYRQVLAADDRYAEAHANLGALLKERGNTEDALKHLEQALRLKPSLAPAAFNLAMLRVAQNQWEDAAALLRSSLQHDPKQVDANLWLGNALMGLGSVDAARDAYRAAIGLDGKYAPARWGLVMAQLPAVPQTEAEQVAGVRNFSAEIKKFQNWLKVHHPEDAYLAVGAQQPFYLAYAAQNHRDALREYGGLCTRMMAGWASKAGLPSPADLVQRAKCKLGIVSAHIGNHSVWHAVVRGWVEHLDPKKFEVHLFHVGNQNDAETQWAAKQVKTLHCGVGDWTQWAQTISAERCDVLLYPEIGMDATTVRLSALRLAPKQFASWGHPITTGLPTMDGFVSAAAFEPANAQQHYTEPLLMLPGIGCCYRPFGISPSAIDLRAWGIASADRVLVCAGTPFKYAPADDPIFVDIVRRCRPCKLVFFQTRPHALSDLLERRLRSVFETQGERFDDSVRFIPWQTQAGFFGLLDRAYVLLDSLGFSGFNTTMQAVERGLPVVAWEGDFLRGRFASGILREAGLGEWVVNSADAYAEKVHRLCLDDALRERVRRHIAEHRALLFNDHEKVAAFGRLLLGSG
jgi:predicted O-linked N-acetylglucosamine transferase (SPINDLY family)